MKTYVITVFIFDIQLYDDACYARIGFLVSRFRPEMYMWEVVLLLRLMLLTAVLVLLEFIVPVQTMAGITVLFLANLLQESNKVRFSKKMSIIYSHLYRRH